MLEETLQTVRFEVPRTFSKMSFYRIVDLVGLTVKFASRRR
jgi:hypothetical protein